jgi:hypothetical protein
VRSGQCSDERSNSGSEVLLCEFDNLRRLADSLLPEKHNGRRLLVRGRQCNSATVLVLDQFVPDGNVNLSSDALGNLAPAHVSARRLHGPDNLADSRAAFDQVREWERASFGNQCVRSGLDKEFDQRRVRLVVWDEDRSEAVESTRKQGCQEFDAVGLVDGHALGSMLLQVVADNSNLLAYAV